MANESNNGGGNKKRRGSFYLNRVLRLGNLVKDPELRRFNGGKGESVKCTFTIATSIPHSTKDLVLFTDVEVWGDLAEYCGQYLQKGREALIEGPEVPDYYEKDGQKRTVKRIVATYVQFGKSPRRDNDSSSEEDNAPIDWKQVPD